jgi:hypothetical protein
MFPHSPFASPVGSFQIPVPPPPLGGGSCNKLRIEFDAGWLPYVIGALQQLTLQATWIGDKATVIDTQRRAAAIIASVQQAICIDNEVKLGIGVDTENMIRQDPDNPCLLQTSIDGVNWCTFADISKCGTPNNQPGAGSPQPQPGGGTQCYDTQLRANDRFFIPTTVSEGDQISISFGDGVWGDPSSPLPRCGDGNVYLGVACQSGTEFTVTGDPMNTKPHMSIVVNVGGTFYAQVDGVITVPSGVHFAQAWVQANTDPLNAASGSMPIHVCVTNNQATVWSHTFQLPTGSDGWFATTDGTTPDTTYCQYVPLSGFEANCYLAPDGAHQVIAYISIAVPVGAQIQGIAFTYDMTPVGGDQSSFVKIFYASDASADEFDWTPSTGTDLVHSQANTNNRAASHIVCMVKALSDHDACGAAVARISQVVLSGIGGDPF